MGLPMGTSPAALVSPAMLQQQQQAMMNGQQGTAGQYGAGGYGGYVDPYNPTGAMPGAGYPPGGYGPQAYGYGGMSGYGGTGGYGGMQSSPYGYQGQTGGYYDPNNPYAAVPGMNVQAPAYGMNQQYGGQFGGQYGGQMGGFPPQPGYPGAQSLPPQPGYPAAAPGSAAPQITPGYPGGQVMPGYGQQPMQQAMGGAYQQQSMDPYQQQVMQGYQQPAMQPGMPGGYQQQAMQGYQQPMAAQPYGYQGQAPNVGVGYSGQIYPRSVPGPVEPVTLDVALIRQITIPAGKQVSLMQDGETLKGGPDGDRFKLVVRTNCECSSMSCRWMVPAGRSRSFPAPTARPRIP